MSVSIDQIKTLRAQTNVAMMACKKALEDAGGDMEKAIELLRKRGETKAGLKSDRETAEGAIAISGRAIIKLLCETDFVAKNESFLEFAQKVAEIANEKGAESAKNFFESEKSDKIQSIGENLVLDSVEVLEGDVVGGYVHSNAKIATIVVLDGGTPEQAKDVAMHATAMDPLCTNPEDVDPALIEKEKEIAREQLLSEGKPENILENIIAGKIKKFCAERALASQPFVKDPSQTVSQFLGGVKIITFVRMSI